MTKKKISLDQILNMTQQLHELVSNGEWEEADQLEKIRQSNIRTYFAKNDTVSDAVAITQYIKDIQQLDRDIAEISAQAKQKIAAEISKMQYGRTAVGAYQATK